MPGARLNVLRSAIAAEWSRVRPISGLQRAAVMGLAVLVVEPWLGWTLAASAGVAALLVGMLDLRQNPRNRLHTMAVGTATLTVTTFLTRELSPWPAAVIALLALIAYGEGAGVAVHRDAPVLLQLNAIVAATALLEPQPRSDAWQAALVVLVAGSVQSLASALYAARRHVVREIDVAASAMHNVGEFLRAAAATTPSDVDSAMERAARSLSSAQHAIAVSGLPPDSLTLLRRALFAVDQVRAQGQALVLRARTVPAPATATDDELALSTQRMRDAGDLLCRGADALRGRRGKRDQAWALLQQTLDGLHPADASRLADPVRPFSGSVKAALQPGGVPFRFGVRIALAALVAGLIGSVGDLTHASWSVNASLSVLRPDAGGLLTRFILRASATALAAGGVVLEVVLVQGNRPGLAVSAVIFGYLMFSLGPANYGIYGLTVTLSVLTLAAITTSHAQHLAVARLVDTAVGCVVALAAGFAIPVWKVTRLPEDVAAYCTTLSRRFTGLAAAALQSPGERDPVALRATGIETRDAVTGVLATLASASLEPAGQVPVARLHATFDELRECARIAVVAEGLLNGRQPVSPLAAGLAQDTATTLELLADAIRQGRPARLKVRPAVPGDAEIELVMRDALLAAIRGARVGWGTTGQRSFSPAHDPRLGD